MKKIILIVPIIFLLLLTFGVKAQTEINNCPDNCNNSIMYTKGHFDDKAKICIYDLQEICKYGCQSDKDFTNPVCNILPPQNASTSLEKIYSDLIKIQNQTINSENNYAKLLDEITKLKTQVYRNSPSLSVHGTEYEVGQSGKIWVQLLDENKNPVENATCYTDIYYPDGSKFTEKSLMLFLENGIYEYDFSIPDYVGVYPSIVNCYYISTSILYNATSGVVDIGNVSSGNYISTQILDNVFWTIKENNISGGVQHFKMRMNFTGIIQPFLQTGLTISWTGKWDAKPNSDSANIYIMNFTNGKWFLLPNKILDTKADILTYVNTIITTNATRDGWIKNGTVSILINDSNIADTDITEFKTDYMYIGVQAQSSPEYINIIGSGEIHVSSPLNLLYNIETLCGDITINNYVTMSDCSIFVNDDDFDFIEGEIIDNITIFALDTRETYWSYFSPSDIDCSALYWIKMYNGTEWVEIDLETVSLSSKITEKNCKIDVPIDMIKGETYEYMIMFDNYLKYDVIWAYAYFFDVNNTVDPVCKGLANMMNYTFEIPILENTTIPSELNYSSFYECYYILDDLYWAFNSYFDSINVTVVSEYLSTYVEAEYYKDIISQRMGMWTYQNLYHGLAENIWEYGVRNLTDYNQTKLLTILQEINQTVAGSSVNITGILNYLAEINTTMHEINSSMVTYYGNLYNLMVSINASIVNEINAINSTINTNIFTITGKLQEIQDNITMVYNLVGASNATIMNKLHRIQDEITSVNDTVKSINQSIHSHLDSIDSTLNSIQGDLTQIKSNLTEVKAILQEINSTTYLISGKIDNLSLDLASINASVISYIGTSLNALESNLTTLIISVNDTVISSNSTIMNKLYGIQGELANMTDEIINNLLNITNITANITLSQQEVINTMVALYGNQAKNRNFAYLGVGITGLLAGGDSGAVQYCKDNMTLATYSVQNVTGSINMTNVFEDLTQCTYGCVKNACVIPQYMIWLYVLIALIGVFGIYLWLEKYGWSSEN